VLLPSAGTVRVAGRVISTLPARARARHRLLHTGQVAQTLPLVAHLTAEENILLPAVLRGDGVLPRARAHELAESLQISGLLRRRPARLSQGERQRVSVCAALINRPPVLLLDEPTGHLDPARAGLVLELLRVETAGPGPGMGVSVGVGVLMATHDPAMLAGATRRLDVRSLAGVAPDPSGLDPSAPEMAP
jgi:putative ABC transport system ATP-binding protein